MSGMPSIFLLAVFLLGNTLAFADQFKDKLNQQYKKHVLVLRSPFTPGEQKFDSTGNPLAHPQGKWLLYGGLFIEKIGLSSKELRVEGRRVAFGKSKIDKPFAVFVSKTVKVEIELDQPLTSIDQAQALLGRVFYPETDPAERAQPELRRADFNLADDPVYKAGKDGVQYPKAKYTPEPDFSEQARRARYQGTVVLNVIVDHTGRVASVRLERALGLGLDENAMEQVKNWRFDPATRDGQPVAVEMRIEVDFQLH